MTEEVKIIMSLLGDEVINVNNTLLDCLSENTRHDRTGMHPTLLSYIGSIRRAIVVGAGGIGAWVAHFLSVSDLVQELHLYDSDTIETHNHSRFMFPPEMTGKAKVTALSAMIKMCRPQAMVISHQYDFTTDELDTLLQEETRFEGGGAGDSMQELTIRDEAPGQLGPAIESNSLSEDSIFRHTIASIIYGNTYQVSPLLIIDTTDNVEFQRTLSNYCHTLLQEHMNRLVKCAQSHTSIPNPGSLVPIYIRASYNGIDHVTITRRFSEFGADQAQGRYDVIPSFPLPAILAATHAVYGGLQAIQDTQCEIHRKLIDTCTDTNIFTGRHKQMQTTVPWLKYKREPTTVSGHYHPKLETMNNSNFKLALHSKDKQEAHEAMMKCVPSLYPVIVNGDNRTQLSIKRGTSHGMGQLRVCRVLDNEAGSSPDNATPPEQDPRDDGASREGGVVGVSSVHERRARRARTAGEQVQRMQRQIIDDLSLAFSHRSPLNQYGRPHREPDTGTDNNT